MPWVAGALLSNIPAGTVLADTLALTPAGSYLVTLLISANTEIDVAFQWRDATNLLTNAAQIISCQMGPTTVTIAQPITILSDERFRVVTVADLPFGSPLPTVSVSIFYAQQIQFASAGPNVRTPGTMSP